MSDVRVSAIHAEIACLVRAPLQTPQFVSDWVFVSHRNQSALSRHLDQRQRLRDCKCGADLSLRKLTERVQTAGHGRYHAMYKSPEFASCSPKSQSNLEETQSSDRATGISLDSG